jgi:hypothetical protein
MVRSTVSFVLATVILLCGNAVAQERNLGLGIILGEPTGLSGKLWTSNTTAIDGAAAWSFGDKDALHLHVDYLAHNFNLLRLKQGKLPLYYGIGGRIKFDNHSKVGIRIPVGINYIFPEAPLDIFFEIVPLLDLAPSTEFGLNGAIGTRYFFQ